MPSAYLVYNPYAGRFPSWLLTERAASVLHKEGWQIHLEKTRDAIHITQLARQAAAERMDALFVVGGDGSLNLAVAGLLGSKTALGVLPGGTGNVWAQELGLPGLTWRRWMALEESARRLAKAPVHRVDVGLCGERHFLLWAGVGLDGLVIHRMEPRPRWEKQFAYILFAANTLWNASIWHGMNLRVEADGKEIIGRFLLAVVSNIHLYAGGLACLSPHARLDDGIMDLWLFKGETLGDAVQRAWDLLAGRHVESDQVLSLSFQELTLESDTSLYVQLDGDPYESSSKHVSITVLPQALNALVPETTPHPLFSQQMGS